MKKALDCVNDYQLESACKDAMYMGEVYISPIWGAKTLMQIEPNFFGGRCPRRNHTI